MEELKELLEAIAKLVTALGTGWTVAIFAALLGYHEWREWRKGKAEASIADEKERQIQRLAEDNRWMRQVLMEKVMGFSEEEARRLVSGSSQLTPLLSDGKKEKK